MFVWLRILRVNFAHFLKMVCRKPAKIFVKITVFGYTPQLPQPVSSAFFGEKIANIAAIVDTRQVVMLYPLDVLPCDEIKS